MSVSTLPSINVTRPMPTAVSPQDKASHLPFPLQLRRFLHRSIPPRSRDHLRRNVKCRVQLTALSRAGPALLASPSLSCVHCCSTLPFRTPSLFMYDLLHRLWSIRNSDQSGGSSFSLPKRLTASVDFSRNRSIQSPRTVTYGELNQNIQDLLDPDSSISGVTGERI